LNREVVRRANWAHTPLAEGDRIEIVHFVGGGAPQAMLPRCNSKRGRKPFHEVTRNHTK
jgi:hypothetical protein